MQIILSDFISLDGVVQAPGGREEDTDGGFAHGGWSMPYFDPEAMGSAIDEVMADDRGAAVRPAHLADDGGRLARPRRRPVRRPHERDPQVRGVPHAQPGRPHLVQLDPAASRRRHRRGAASCERGTATGLQVMGSASLAAQLIEHDLVDEYRLMIEPILLGGGKRLFPDDGRPARSSWSRPRLPTTGVLICTYRPAGR